MYVRITFVVLDTFWLIFLGRYVSTTVILYVYIGDVADAGGVFTFYIPVPARHVVSTVMLTSKTTIDPHVRIPFPKVLQILSLEVKMNSSTIYTRTRKWTFSITTPFIPTYVISSLSLVSDPARMYNDRVKGRRILLENPARNSRAEKELDRKRTMRRKECEKKKLGGVISKKKAKEMGIWKLDEEQAKWVLVCWSFDFFFFSHWLSFQDTIFSFRFINCGWDTRLNCSGCSRGHLSRYQRRLLRMRCQGRLECTPSSWKRISMGLSWQVSTWGLISNSLPLHVMITVVLSKKTHALLGYLGLWYTRPNIRSRLSQKTINSKVNPMTVAWRWTFSSLVWRQTLLLANNNHISSSC